MPPLTLKLILGPCYDQTAEQLEARLQPIDAAEVSLAVQIVRAYWRLDRCERAQNPQNPAIDRIRHCTEAAIRRDMAELRRLQANRLHKAALAQLNPIANFENLKKRTQSEAALGPQPQLNHPNFKNLKKRTQSEATARALPTATETTVAEHQT